MATTNSMHTNRKETVISAMTTYGVCSERNASDLGNQLALAKKFATDVRTASGRLRKLIEVFTGEEDFDLGPRRTRLFSDSNRFDSPIITEREKEQLTAAYGLLNRVAKDIDEAARAIEKLHKQREKEEQERLLQARSALNAALFDGLDLKGQALLLASSRTWQVIVQAACGEQELWEPANTVLKREVSEVKGDMVRRLAVQMKTTGRSAGDLAAEVASRFRSAEVEEQQRETVEKIVTFLVAEQISDAAKRGARS